MSFQISQPPLLLPPRAKGQALLLGPSPPPLLARGKKVFLLVASLFRDSFFFFSRRHPLKTAYLVFLFENSIFCGLVENLLAPCSLCKQFR